MSQSRNALTPPAGVSAEEFTRLLAQGRARRVLSVDDVMARLATEAARRVIVDLEAANRRSGGLNEDVAWLKLTLEEVRESATAVEATGRLVRWIVDRFEVGA